MSWFLSCFDPDSSRQPSSELTQIAQSTTSFSDLPEELVIEILRRLPVKSLMRSACVSKSWLSIVSDPKFGKSQFRLASELGTVSRKVLIINYPMLENSIRGSCSFVPLRIGSLNDKFALKSVALACEEIEGMRPLHSCNGLLLLGRYDYSSFCIWNLSTASYRLICDPCLTLEDERSLYYICSGFGYVSTNDDYKLVIVAPPRGNGIKMHIFSLTDNNWRVITAPPFLSWSVWRSSYSRKGVFSNGSIHWVTGSDDEAPTPSIYAFDVEKEEMRIMALPHGLQYDEDVRNSYGMTPEVHLGGYLCIWSRIKGLRCKGEIWVMTEYEAPTSWVQLFSFGRYDSLDDELEAWPRGGDLRFITESGTMVIEQHRELYWIDFPNGGDPLCSKHYRLQGVPPLQYRTQTVLYVIAYDETLVPVS